MAGRAARFPMIEKNASPKQGSMSTEKVVVGKKGFHPEKRRRRGKVKNGKVSVTREEPSSGGRVSFQQLAVVGRFAFLFSSSHVPRRRLKDLGFS